MPNLDRDKFIKVLGMLGSSHDGEVASAARRALLLLKQANLTWEDVILSKSKSKPKSKQYDESEEVYKSWEEDKKYKDAQRAWAKGKTKSKSNLRSQDQIDTDLIITKIMCLTLWEQGFALSLRDQLASKVYATIKQREQLDKILSKLKGYRAI